MIPKTTIIRIVGDTPLIYREWVSHAGCCRPLGEKRVPLFRTELGRLAYYEQERLNSGEFLPKVEIPDDPSISKYPSIAIRIGMVTACTSAMGFTKRGIRQAFRMADEFTLIQGSKPKYRAAPIRIVLERMMTTVVVEWPVPWFMDVKFVYDPDVITEEQLRKLLYVAGFGVGIGEWRPERDGQNGMFHVDEMEETKKVA